MTAPTWAEAREAEEEARVEYGRASRELQKSDGPDDFAFSAISLIRYDQALTAARRASDLALVREVLKQVYMWRGISKQGLDIVAEAIDDADSVLRDIEKRTERYAAVLAALEQEGGGNG